MEKTWNIPNFNLSCLILGTGCSITTAATRLLSISGTYVMHSGSGGTPVFMTSLTDYRPTYYFQKWVSFWTNPEARLHVAKFLAEKRCLNLETNQSPQNIILEKSDLQEAIKKFRHGISNSNNINELTGHEGIFAKTIYKNVAQACYVNWEYRDNSKNRDKKNNINKLLDDSNYIIYGISGLSVFLMGLVPQMPVTHGMTRAGGLIFDIADVFKDSISLPCAFSSCSEGYIPGSEYRKKMVDWCDKNDLLRKCVALIKEAVEVGFDFCKNNNIQIVPDIFFTNNDDFYPTENKNVL
jgi:CRISPR-associated protein Cas1